MLILSTILTVFGCITAVVESTPETVIANTQYGTLQGTKFTLEKRKTGDITSCNMFRGIQYAKAPRRELRFAPPMAPDKWTGVKEATKWASSCIQTEIFGRTSPEHRISESEDCLYLNVFAPSGKEAEGLQPVMVYLHGGGFSIGSAHPYGDRGICERLVPKGVVVVTMQYRLGIFGFLSTGDDAARGNWGLMDIKLGLEWIRDNIANFGGDKDKITLFGESAGGALVGLLSLSPMSRDLFHGGILMSGAPSAYWALSESTKRTSLDVVEKIGCDLPSHLQMIDCLRATDADILINATFATWTQTQMEILPFTPLIDGYFLPKSLDELYRESKPMPLMEGTVADEMAFITTPPNDLINTAITYRDPDTFTIEKFRQAVNDLIPENTYGNATALLRRLAEHEYLYSKGDWRNSTFRLEQYTKLFNDYSEHVPHYVDAIRRMNAGWRDVWLYSFDYYNQAAFPANNKFKGVYHMNELVYLFDMQMLYPIKYNNQDEQMFEIFTTLWTNFAKYGKPTLSNSAKVEWDRLKSSINREYFSINLEPRMMHGFQRAGTSFWTELVPQVYQLVQNYVLEENQQNEIHDEL